MKVAAGVPFPERALPTVEGPEAPILEGRPRLVIVGHRDCKTTRQTLPYVDKINRLRPGTAVAVLQDVSDVALELRRELHLSLPLLLEPSPYPLTEQLGLTAVPTLLLVDGSGTVQKVVEGFDRNALEAFAEALDVPRPLFATDDRSPAFRPG